MMTMKTDYLLSLDAGGTKTRAIAYRADDFTPVMGSEVFTGPGNLADSPDAAVRSILEAAEACSKKAEAILGGACPQLTLGAAGLSALPPDSPADRMLRDGLGQIAGHTTLVNDALLALHANFASDEAGMIVISGTGSAIFCQARGPEGDPVVLRAGGWGSLLGDGGSAFSVSRAAVRGLLALLDEGRTPDAEDFFGRWKGAAPGDKPFFDACSTAALIALSMRRLKRELAALAPGIAALAEHPDDSDAAALCREILASEADALAGDVRRLLASLDRAGRMPETKLPVVLTGGFFAHTPLFCALFRKSLAGHADRIEYRPAADPTRAVIRHYRESTAE